MPNRSRISFAVLGLAYLTSTMAVAEEPVDRTGTGGGPRSTITAPNTNSLGVTKPPGSGEGPETPGERREMNAVRRQNNAIDGSICDGCGVK